MPDVARPYTELIALLADDRYTTGQDLRDIVKTVSSRRLQIAATASVVHDYQDGNVLEIAMGTNITSLTVTGGIVGLPLRIVFTQDATGGRTVAGMSGFVHENASAPVLSTTPLRADLFDYWYDGASWVQV